MAIPQEEDQTRLRSYLLGDLTEEEEGRVELRLLSDAGFAEVFDAVEDELIEQYVDDELTAEERGRFEGYFLLAPERRTKLGVARALRSRSVRKMPPATPARPSSGFYLRLAACTLLVLGLGFGGWRVFFYKSTVDQGMLALQAAYGGRGDIEARVTGLKQAPAAPQRGTAGRGDEIEQERAGLLLRNAVRESPDAESHHALGKLYLLQREFDKAIDQFDEALRRAPLDARVHSDLGAALFERGKLRSSERGRGEGSEDFARSIEHLKKALELDGTLLEAVFNRALVYQHQHLLPQAGEDWRRYLEADSTSLWADEARKNLRRLEEQMKRGALSNEEIFEGFLGAVETGDDEAAWGLVRHHQGRKGNVVVERLLDAHLEPDGEAAGGKVGGPRRASVLLAKVGELASERAGERFFSDVARYYRTMTPQQTAAVTEARRLMKSGYDGWGRVGVAESLDTFNRARLLFGQAGDTCEQRVAEYWVGFSQYRQMHKEGSLATFEGLERDCAGSGYKWLQVRALWGISLVQNDYNELSKSIEYGRRSLALAEQTGDTVGLLNAMGTLIAHHRYLSDSNQALSYIQSSTPLVASTSLDPVLGSRHFSYEAAALSTLGLDEAAVEYQKEALRYALSSGNPSTMSVNHAELGSLYGRLRDYGEALKHIRRAIEIAESRDPDPAVQELIAYSHLLLGHLRRREGDLPQAVASYDRAVELYGRLGLPTFLYQAHKGRLLCYVAQKRDEQVKGEIAAALSLAELHRDKILDEDTRNNFFDAEQSAYDVAIDFAHSRLGDDREAFNYSEFSKARSLLDALNAEAPAARRADSAAVRPMRLSEVQALLPEQVQVVQYAVLEDKLLVWVISKSGFSAKAVSVTREELTRQVLSYRSLISRPPEDGAAASEESRRAGELYGILLGPVESALAEGKQVCIVPDKVLNYLPFGPLVSTRSGRHLIEERRVVLAPSSTVFVVCTQAAGRKRLADGGERLLSVGNPSFSRQDFPSLPDLPSAETEAREVSAYYESARLLTGPDARADAVKDGMGDSEVIHLALHSVLDPRFPMRSKLLLAKGPGGGGLTASDISGLTLSRTRLVVLSACQTAAERYYGGEGMIGMARPFIAAGVPLVAASLWPVDSDSTAGLMIRFHNHRKLGQLPAAEALRLAQLEMLNDPDARRRHPYYWAAFILVGGYSEY